MRETASIAAGMAHTRFKALLAVAKAEIRYEKTMKDIQKKDKRFQLEINKLDSEHNALQNEIDSIRSQVSKNVERSFKTFS